jgi:predicted AAA+ superfamily ATPase
MLLNYIRTRVDLSGRRRGMWFLTGSQEPPLMKGVTESMAGRAAIFQLLPFSNAETDKVTLLKGGFPEVIARPNASEIWFRSYLQTYLERDVRSFSSIRDLSTFRRFLSLLASRIGQVLNRTDIAAPLGLSIPTISEWLNILEATHQIILVPPYFENFGKRLIKSPKVYFTDTGLAAHLLGISSEKALKAAHFLGPLFENFTASEIVKAQVNGGRRKELYYFRDRQGLEVDFLVPGKNYKLILIEAKASRTLSPALAAPMARLKKSISRYTVESFIVHLPSKTLTKWRALGGGVHSISCDEISKIFS